MDLGGGGSGEGGDIRVAEAVDEGLLATSVPSSIAVLSSIPHNFVHDLGNGNGVSRRAVRGAEATAVGVGNVGLVIRRVEIDTIPAGREDDGSTDTSGAELGWELARVLGITRSETLAVSEAAMADRGFVFVLLVRGVSGDHPEAGLECRHLAILRRVRHVVDSHASVLLKAEVGKLGNPLEGAILRGLEV